MTSASNQQLYLYQSATAPTSNITIGVWGVASAAAFFIVTKHETVIKSHLILTSHLVTRDAPGHEKCWDWKSQVLALDEDLKKNIFLEDDMNNAWITNL